MKLNIIRTADGFRCATDEDLQKSLKMKRGTMYEVTLKKVRNVDMHRKYFALINCTWDFLTDSQQAFFGSSEGLRKSLQLAVGHCDRVYSPKLRQFVDIPKSIAFDAMEELDFEQLYEKTLMFIVSNIVSDRQEEFNEHLKDF